MDAPCAPAVPDSNSRREDRERHTDSWRQEPPGHIQRQGPPDHQHREEHQQVNDENDQSAGRTPAEVAASLPPLTDGQVQQVAALLAPYATPSGSEAARIHSAVLAAI